MKKPFLLIFLVIGATICFSQSIRENIGNGMIQGSSASVSGKAPDYSNLYYWAAHPYKHNTSDSIPSFLKGEKRDTSVDVFFLYPTTFTSDFKNAPMNADIDDTALNKQTDARTILFQASVFNGSARIFAPRYRQAHFKAFFMPNATESKKAFDLAYSDLERAFQYYLDHWNKGRPIIIAGHSQGSMHAVRLLKEFFDGKPLQKQLVCAYIPGWQIKKDDLKNIPLGASPNQTNCVLTWRTFKKGKVDKTAEMGAVNSLCVNPISWTTDSTWTTPDMHKGAVGRDFNRLAAHKIIAGINKTYNILWVQGNDDKPLINSDENDKVMSGFAQAGNLHIADFNLFYMDVRENVKLRVNAWFKKQQ